MISLTNKQTPPRCNLQVTSYARTHAHTPHITFKCSESRIIWIKGNMHKKKLKEISKVKNKIKKKYVYHVFITYTNLIHWHFVTNFMKDASKSVSQVFKTTKHFEN